MIPVRRLSEIEPENPWPVSPGVAYRGKLTFLAGREGHGKSTLIRQCAASIARGEPDWLGRPHGAHRDIPYSDGVPVRRPVLWIGEERPSAIAAAFEPFIGDDEHAESLILVMDPDDLREPGDLAWAVKQYRPDLIVVDPAADLYRMEDERDYSKVRRTIRRAYDEVFAEYDLLLMPTTPMAATPLPGPDANAAERSRRATEMLANTGPFDVTGHPAITLPCGATTDGRPVGMMLVGRLFDEITIYRAAYAFEWTGRG